MNALRGAAVAPRPRWAPSRARRGPAYSLSASLKHLGAAATASGALRRRALASAPLASALVARAAAEAAPQSEETVETDEEPWIKSEPDAAPTFADLGVDRLFLDGLREGRIEEPSPIQESAIPVLLQGGNAAIQSYTGSGKTLAYLLPTMTRAFRRAEEIYRTQSEGWSVQLLVVVPSQELAMQIVRAARALLPEPARPAVQQLIGGANPLRQREALAKHRPLVAVGTPGRLAEMVRTGALLLHRCPMLVLDEADQLLGSNFSEDLTHVCEHAGRKLPEGRQTVLVSATLSASVMARFGRWCPDPQFVTAGGAAAPRVTPFENGDGGGGDADAGAEGPGWGWGVRGWEGPAPGAAPRTHGTAGGAEGGEGLVPTMPPALRHVFITAEPRHRVDALRRCVHALGAGRALVFMNWQQRLRDARHKLTARGMAAAELHGEMGKQARQSVLEGFARGEYRALLVSDVAARGLDVPGVDAVFNLELPSNAAHYAHRAGRTGRMGAPGVVVSVVEPGERFVIERLAARLGVAIEEAHVDGGEFVLGPPRPEAPAKRKRRAAPAADADGGDADAAGGQKAQGQQRQQQRRGDGKSKGKADDDEEEVWEDEEEWDQEEAAAAAARAAAAKSKLSRDALKDLEGFLQREAQLGPDAAGPGGGAPGGGAPGGGAPGRGGGKAGGKVRVFGGSREGGPGRGARR
ncbi:DEAD-box ATP-dependent RNA helicase, mitochondrial [Raphidocelis subcapitata]|uniref:DEAD-box ATP-dependent RNA helicase, mitochondrial n=1 Tax=Raphidocelis subcapitata TaxID=307507 RepID=A0A2V0NRJ9_9CHLO|nr:DEAD-box ATP-dependent RNA helicase, mitochondrial [Raphidocelis subcapitata]|eukprot:GBF90298.1 DEAD-box ATP-dependent RNA helicase, mitochondrial [Raphidocelis subcapitata]